MKYDHIIQTLENPAQQRFHLSCGFYETTSFFFEPINLSVEIHCKGEFVFRTAEGEVLEKVQAQPMDSGRECYMDVLITSTEQEILFQLPEYAWIDHYPNCDGESDRWDAKIIGIRDEVRYPLSK